MTTNTSNALDTAIRRLLRPLIRLLLRNGMAYADFTSLLRREFVEVAAEDFTLPGRKQSVSRVSVITGINRKEVKRILDNPDELASAENNRAARVISGWMRDDEFTDSNDAPRPLSWGVAESSYRFENLVKKHSGDMPARSVLDELVRVGAVTLDEDTVTLTATGYIPAASNEELLHLSGVAIADLINTIDYNLDSVNPQTRLQLSVAYDNVSQQGVELFRNLSKEKSIELLNYLDSFLVTQDRSANPSIEGEGRFRTGLGLYYFEESVDPADTDSSGGEQ
ncbi:MAG: DUF6502 family protein [Pseudomonadota bacterium]